MSPHAVPTPAAARGRVAPIKFAHIVFRTSQSDVLVAWYCKVLEAEVALANELLTFLTFDDEHHRIAIVGMPGLHAPQQPSAGLEHFAFTYASLADLLATYRRLRADGILPYWNINHGPNLSFYYRDPDGNQIELTVDVFDTAEAVNRWYESSDFAVNPIGVKFEADELIRRFEAGESHESLTRRPRIPHDQVLAQLP